MEIVFIDHYDSFSDNVLDWLSQSLEITRIKRVFSDKICARHQGYPIVLSPGPCSPSEAPRTLEIVTRSLGRIPILGICLGHQILGTLAGWQVAPSSAPRHGLVRSIRVLPGSWFLSGGGASFYAAAYNSLELKEAEQASIQPGWHVTARCEDQTIQAVEYLPDYGFRAMGVQFHPESFLTPKSDFMRNQWISECLRWQNVGHERRGHSTSTRAPLL